jgi:GTP-binding nuclear protein Ran
MNTLKVSLIGDFHVGKTSLVSYLLTGQIPPEYSPTLGVEVHPVVHNHRRFNVWDTAGSLLYGGLSDGYYVQSDLAIVMYDHPGMFNTGGWELKFRCICPDALVIKCVNLVNLYDHLEPTQFNRPREHVFFVNLARGQGVDELMQHLCNVAVGH